MKTKIAIISAIGLGIVLAACSSYKSAPKPAPKMAKKSMMPFSDPVSVSYSQNLWSAMKSAKVVGAGSKNPAPYKGAHPHGAVLTTATSSMNIGGHKGKLIVKKNYGGPGVSNATVAASPAKYLKAVTVMYQRETGYDADNQNWFWAKYKPDGSLFKNPKGMQLAGRVAKGKPAGCIACHKVAPGGDYIFTN